MASVQGKIVAYWTINHGLLYTCSLIPKSLEKFFAQNFSFKKMLYVHCNFMIGNNFYKIC
jgi:hypothetical protein